MIGETDVLNNRETPMGKTTMDSMKRWLLSTLEKWNLYYLPEWRHDEYVLTRHLRRMIASRQIDTVLDVGANVGQYARFLRDNVGFRGWIHSFEPNPDIHKALRQARAADSKWSMRSEALGETDGTCVLNITDDSQFSSVLTPASTVASIGEWYPDHLRVKGNLEVPMRRLDALLPEMTEVTDKHRLFLKLDTQGNDLAVLNGALEQLQRIEVVQTELSFRHVYAGMPDFLEVNSFLKSHGFNMTGLFPVAVGNDQGLIEADGIYARAKET